MGGVQRQLFHSSEVRQNTNTLLDEYGRDQNSPAEQWRAETDFEAGSGYVKFFHAYTPDLARLISGVQWPLVLFALGDTLGSGRKRKRNEKPPEWTREVSDEYLASICGDCAPRQVERAIAFLTDACPVLAIKPTGKGRYQLKPLCENWRGLVLPDRIPPQSAADEQSAEEDTDSTPISKEAIPLIKKPSPVRRGKTSRPALITTGVKEFTFENRLGTDAVYDVVADKGRLAVVAAASVEDLQNWRNEKLAGNGISELQELPRHKCRDEQKTAPSGADSPAPAARLVEDGSENGRTSKVSEIASPSRQKCREDGIPPTSPSLLHPELKAALQGHGYKLTPALISKIAPFIPAGCPASFIIPELADRVSRGARKHQPLTEAKLVLFFQQDIPERWKAQLENDAAVDPAAPLEAVGRKETALEKAHREFREKGLR